jgi:DNA polymerase III sliding clamp (beta) subunit (PCNA family)
MMMASHLLLKALNVVAPAVAFNYDDSVPILTHVCFTGTHIVAYNNSIGISTPRSSEFEGSIPARWLTDLVKTCHAMVVELQAERRGGHVLVSLDDSRCRFPMLPRAWFPFEMPAMPSGNAIEGIAGGFFEAIEYCLISVSKHATVPDQLGITVIPRNNRLVMFSTNRQSASHATLPLKRRSEFKRRVILSGEFCNQMLRLARTAQTVRFALCKDHAMFVADDTLLFGRLIKSDDPLNFEDALERYLPRDFAKTAVNIPKPEMGIMLKLASRISEIQGNEEPTTIRVKRGVATFKSKSNRGEIEEEIALPGHPNVEAEFRISLLLDAYAAHDRILITKNCAVMGGGDNRFYMAATYGG